MARLVFRAALLAFALLGAALPASAQYFGRNKVQYKTFDFQVLKTEHFDIYFYPSERDGVEIAARMAERWHARLRAAAAAPAQRPPAADPLRLSPRLRADERDSGRDRRRDGRRHRVAQAAHRPAACRAARRHRPRDRPRARPRVSVRHHARPARAPRAAGRRGMRLPLWFIEGMAEYLSIGPVDPHTAMWLRDAARQETAPDDRAISTTRSTFRIAGARRSGPTSAAATATTMIERDAHDRRLPRRRSERGDSNRCSASRRKELSDDWQASIREMYEPVLAATTRPSEIGRHRAGARRGAAN